VSSGAGGRCIDRFLIHAPQYGPEIGDRHCTSWPRCMRRGAVFLAILATWSGDKGGLLVNAVLWLAGASLVAWIGLLVVWGFFWWPAPRLTAKRETSPSEDSRFPSVAAVIPARNEAEILPESLPSVLGQEYDGPFRVVLVDDRSDDGTEAAARTAAEQAGSQDRLTVLRGEPLREGWSGKVWAMHQGTASAGDADWIWLTDADIAHDPWVLEALVELAEREGRDLVSTMATLRIESAWDRLLIPSFVYFFAKLYPFRFVSNPRRRTAGAAGGCILVRREQLERAGGIAAIRGALIDDCALGRLIKRSGRSTWLGFSKGVRSLRGYGTLRSVWDMVARSAYTQLGHSPFLLVGTVLGMLFLYALPPVICVWGAIAALLGVTGGAMAATLGGAAWALMAGSFLPMLHHHRAGWWMAPLLPLAAVLYTLMTLSSAWRHARGRGGAWKGRTYSGRGAS